MRGQNTAEISVKIPHQDIAFAIEVIDSPNNAMFCDIRKIDMGPYWGKELRLIEKATIGILEPVLVKFTKEFFEHSVSQVNCAHLSSHEGELAIQNIAKIQCVYLDCINQTTGVEFKRKFERNEHGKWTLPRDMAWGDMFRFLHILCSDSNFASSVGRRRTSYDGSWAEIRYLETHKVIEECFVDIKVTDEIALVSQLGAEPKYAFAKVPASCKETDMVSFYPEIPVMEDLAFALTVALVLCCIWEERETLIPVEVVNTGVDDPRQLIYLEDDSPEVQEEANLKRMIIDSELNNLIAAGHDLFEESEGVVNFGEAAIHYGENGLSIRKENQNSTPWMTIQGLQSLVWLLLGSNAAKSISAGACCPSFNFLFEKNWIRCVASDAVMVAQEKKPVPPTISLDSPTYVDELTTNIMSSLEHGVASYLERCLKEVL